MNALLACAPILVVAVGALLLMLAEAFGQPAVQKDASGGAVIDAGAGRSGELALGSAVALFAGAFTSLGLWWVGPERLEGVADLVDIAEIDDGAGWRPMLVRKTCCFAYALPGFRLCTTCCLLTDAQPALAQHALRDGRALLRRRRPDGPPGVEVGAGA